MLFSQFESHLLTTTKVKISPTLKAANGMSPCWAGPVKCGGKSVMTLLTRVTNGHLPAADASTYALQKSTEIVPQL